MNAVDFAALTLASARQELLAKTCTAAELEAAARERVAQVDSSIHAFLRLTPTLSGAAATDAGQYGSPLAGMPIAIKDNLATAGVETTAGSKILSGYVPAEDATVVAKLRAAGATVIGKTNLDEFAMGSSTENSAFGPTTNPYDGTRVPGGSSGGSAAAVASGQVLAALGTDTGGSVRQPAAFCGLVGLKPTYGRVSRYGLIALTSSTDVVGTLTKTAADAATLLQAIAGHDVADATTLAAPVPDYTAELNTPLKGLRVGVVQECFGEGIEPGVRQSVQTAIETLRSLGATVADCSIPHNELALWVYYIVTPAEASTNLSRFDGIRYGATAPDSIGQRFATRIRATRGQLFGAEPLRRILLGTYALSAGYSDAFYTKAQRVRRLLHTEYLAALDQFDVLLTPTTPTTAFPLGAKPNPLSMYLQDVNLVGPSLVGVPALSVPTGVVDQLPVGMQLIGRPLAEAKLLNIAHQFEQVRGPLPLTLAL